MRTIKCRCSFLRLAPYCYPIELVVKDVLLNNTSLYVDWATSSFNLRNKVYKIVNVK
jgi:hypothetical protein